MTTEEKIWLYFKNKDLKDYAIAGIIGNLYAESKLLSNNLEDSRNKTFGMTDELYTSSVDNETYSRARFIHDSAGYGLAQWTLASRKERLYNITRGRGVSISNIDAQLDLIFNEIMDMNLFTKLNNCNNIKDTSNVILFDFENPADKSIRIQDYRAELSQSFYDRLKNIEGGTSMKYNSSNAPLKCMMTNSSCFKGTRKMDIKGVLIHSTGANNPYLKRYVQPSTGDANYQKLMSLLGKNQLGNDWNHIELQAGVNAWVGKLEDGTITSVQTMPWNYRPWGCGSGSKGSCNDGWIQFEICESDLGNKEYFEAIYKEACELIAYLCKEYNLNPKGTVNFNNINVPVILCHQDSYRLGLGSNHADIYHWFGRYGKTMDNVREDVSVLLTENNTNTSNTNSHEIKSSVNQLTYVRLLRRGRRGDDVVALQEALIALGYSVGPDGADGDYGTNTQSAVIKFQTDNNLDIDGEAGENTIKKINELLNGGVTPKEEKQEVVQTYNDKLYRVRKSWADAASQIGAFAILKSAKKAAERAGAGYYVFDSKGNKVTDTPGYEDVTFAKITYTDVMIGSASKDERGQYRGGQAGDQTGKEVYINNWYNQNWTNVYRPTDPKLAEKIAQVCETGCKNDKIGYSQTDRNTILTQAKKVNYDLSKITTPCNCDCSSFVSAICVCCGLPEATFFPGGNGCVTSTIGPACLSTGKFKNITDTRYTRQKSYLKRGDILCNVNQHVVVVLSDGSNA